MKIIGAEWKIVEKISGLKSSSPDEDWEVSYSTPVYGGWDLMIECSFTKLEELDRIVTALRSDSEIAQSIEETTTLCGTKPNYTK